MKRSVLSFLAVVAFVLSQTFSQTASPSAGRTLQSFGVRVERGLPVRPYPANVALGLFNPDPLLDLAFYIDGKIQVWQNLGNGTFGDVPVFERSTSGKVAKMEWKKSDMFNAMIFNQMSWGDLFLTLADGHTEKIPHENMQNAQRSFASLPQTTSSFPPLNFHEVWRSREQSQPITALLIDDIDNDGKTELVYFIKTLRSQGDTNLILVYEHVADNNYVVEWDTLLHNGGYPYAISDVDRNGRKEIVIISTVNPGMALLECSGPRQYRMCESNIIFTQPGGIYKVVQTNVDHDGRLELSVQHSDPQAPPGVDGTRIYVAEFSSRGGDGSFGFSGEIARYYPYTFDFAVGQVDGTGIEEIVPAGGSFGAHEPVDIDYLWRSALGQWRTRSVYTGLESGTGAVMFVNTDADSTLEFFSGAPGPIGNGSAFLLDYVRDTTWRVVFADSSLRNAPLWVNSGMLNGQFVVAGANTWDRSQLDTTYCDLNAYLSQGQKLGIWRLDSAYINNFYFLDIDRDQKTNLIFAWTSFLPSIRTRHCLRDYESDRTVAVVNDTVQQPYDFRLEQNYPNPFNPATTIRFSIPFDRDASLLIFNILGERVTTLVDGKVVAGNHTIVWDATQFPSGVYFCTLRTSITQLTRKMLVVR
jgi:hypothetical protein